MLHVHLLTGNHLEQERECMRLKKSSMTDTILSSTITEELSSLRYFEDPVLFISWCPQRPNGNVCHYERSYRSNMQTSILGILFSSTKPDTSSCQSLDTRKYEKIYLLGWVKWCTSDPLHWEAFKHSFIAYYHVSEGWGLQWTHPTIVHNLPKALARKWTSLSMWGSLQPSKLSKGLTGF